MSRKEPAVDTPTPQSSPELPAAPTAVPVPTPAPQRPRCTFCGEPVGGDRIGVSWKRRLTDDELAEHVAEVKASRERALLLADPQLPSPVFPPLPDGSNETRMLLACADHAIDMDLASRIHQKTCTAPNEIGQWGCDCTPEALPEAEDEVPSHLPAHWQTGGA